MRSQASDSLAAWPVDLIPPRGVVVLTGYGLDIRVWRGRLRVADGAGHDRREATIHRATGRLRRLVVLGHTGSISLEAIRWLADVGPGFLHIDADGRVLAAFGPQGADRPGLRRPQARALDTSVGIDIARRLIAEKIVAQAEMLSICGAAAMTEETVQVIRDERPDSILPWIATRPAGRGDCCRSLLVRLGRRAHSICSAGYGFSATPVANDGRSLEPTNGRAATRHQPSQRLA